jgi:RNA polymerase sigma factor (sigma-70 family)
VSWTVTERAERQAGRLEELYERHAADAVRLAYLVTSDRELARDIAQDAFVRVAGRFRHLRYPDAFDAYLRRTVVNLCLSHFRHQRVEREYVQREGAAPEGVAEPTELGTRERAASGARKAAASSADRDRSSLLPRPAGKRSRGRYAVLG